MLLMIIVDTAGADRGALWVGRHPAHPDVMWVCDIYVEEDARGHGLGRAAMLAAERLCREAGHDELGLSVFGFREPARGLYESLGYQTVSISMRKNVSEEPALRTVLGPQPLVPDALQDGVGQPTETEGPCRP